jgi:hypothetical protein
MAYSMPVKADEGRLFQHVASLPCQWPGCGRHGVQVAHSNALRDGKGRGLKAFPWRVAALCPEHHYELDQGKNLSKQERRDGFDEAHRATIGELFAQGLVRPV